MRAHRSDPLLAPPLDPELLGSHSGIAGLAGSLWTCWSVLARALSGWAEGVKTVGRVWESGLAAERFQAQSGTHTFRCGAHLQVWRAYIGGYAGTMRASTRGPRLDTVLWAAGALPLTAFAAAAGIGSSLDTLRQGARALVWRRSSLPWVDCGRRWR
ncbi:hypothetical protein AB1Y20_023163 [Prymnesium parvum]|uniref:Uncharacterized protein n=1 Tax=Prymnesium parvum TaxID=97485 RepID=A0AB34JFX7_PRYPA